MQLAAEISEAGFGDSSAADEECEEEEEIEWEYYRFRINTQFNKICVS